MSEYRLFEEIANEILVGDLVEYQEIGGAVYRGTVRAIDPLSKHPWNRLLVDPEKPYYVGNTWGSVGIKILTPHAPRLRLMPGYYPKRPTTNLSKTLKAAPPPEPPSDYRIMSSLVSRGLVSIGDTVEYAHSSRATSRGIVTTLSDGRADTRVHVLDGPAGPCWGDPCQVRVISRVPAPTQWYSALAIIEAGLQVGDEVQLSPRHSIRHSMPAIGIVTGIDPLAAGARENERILVRAHAGELGSCWGMFDLGIRRRAAEIPQP